MPCPRPGMVLLWENRKPGKATSLSGALKDVCSHLLAWLGLFCTTWVTSSLSALWLLTITAPNSLLMTTSRKGLMKMDFFSLSFLRKPGKISECSAATLCMESAAQLFPVLLCQAWSNCRSNFQQRKREEKAWLSVIRRY